MHTNIHDAQGIVTRHAGGRIWAESEGQGRGCTSFVQLTTIPPHEVATLLSGTPRADALDDRMINSTPRGGGMGTRVSSGDNVAALGPVRSPLFTLDEKGDDDGSVSGPTFKPRVLVVDDRCAYLASHQPCTGPSLILFSILAISDDRCALPIAARLARPPGTRTPVTPPGRPLDAISYPYLTPI